MKMFAGLLSVNDAVSYGLFVNGKKKDKIASQL